MIFKRVLCLTAFVFLPGVTWATVFGSVRGVVHDPDHRPVPGAQVVLKANSSDYSRILATGDDGAFEATSVPVGAYQVTVTREGFAPSAQNVVVVSGSAPVLHFQLAIGTAQQVVTVAESALAVNPERMTPTTIVSRSEIQNTPGADLSNSLTMITDYVPGAWVTHDQLHVRGGHQVTWAIDGVPIPNTNIASNVGPQIDPKDIDYLEAQRGGYSSAYGDRTYGVFNVVPRTGFERNNEGEFCSLLSGRFTRPTIRSTSAATPKSSPILPASTATAATMVSKLPARMCCTTASGDWAAWARSSTIATPTTNSGS